MEKVILTKSQANDIEKIIDMDKGEMVTCHIEDRAGWSYKELKTMETDTFIRALYIGYEVEMTPEERVKDYYEAVVKMAGNTIGSHEAKQMQKAIAETLTLLSIKIEGIN